MTMARRTALTAWLLLLFASGQVSAQAVLPDATHIVSERCTPDGEWSASGEWEISTAAADASFHSFSEARNVMDEHASIEVPGLRGYAEGRSAHVLLVESAYLLDATGDGARQTFADIRGMEGNAAVTSVVVAPDLWRPGADAVAVPATWSVASTPDRVVLYEMLGAGDLDRDGQVELLFLEELRGGKMLRYVEIAGTEAIELATSGCR